MPHQVHQRKFGRRTAQRRGMFRNLSLSVLRYERVKTTEAKGKEIRRFVDWLIGLGKDGSLAARRRALAWLPEPVIVEKLFGDLAKRYPDRSSGYVRTTRLPRRVGDSAPLMLLELVPGVDEAPAVADTEEAPRRRLLGLPRRPAKEEAAEKATDEKKAPAAPRKRASKSAGASKTTTKTTKRTTARAKRGAKEE